MRMPKTPQIEAASYLISTVQLPLAFIRQHRARLQIKRLLKNSDRMLTDIGLTREDVKAALSQPGDPSITLNAILRRNAAQNYSRHITDLRLWPSLQVRCYTTPYERAPS